MTRARFSRRTLIKSSLAAAGTATFPSPAAAGFQEPASERLRIGCIGVGGRGTLVGNTACRLGQKVACADVDQQHAERFAGTDQCAAYTDYRQLLDRQDIDVVTVGTPDHWHSKMGPRQARFRRR